MPLWFREQLQQAFRAKDADRIRKISLLYFEARRLIQ